MTSHAPWRKRKVVKVWGIEYDHGELVGVWASYVPLLFKSRNEAEAYAFENGSIGKPVRVEIRVIKPARKVR